MIAFGLILCQCSNAFNHNNAFNHRCRLLSHRWYPIRYQWYSPEYPEIGDSKLASVDFVSNMLVFFPCLT